MLRAGPQLTPRSDLLQTDPAWPNRYPRDNNYFGDWSSGTATFAYNEDGAPQAAAVGPFYAASRRQCCTNRPGIMWPASEIGSRAVCLQPQCTPRKCSLKPCTTGVLPS